MYCKRIVHTGHKSISARISEPPTLPSSSSPPICSLARNVTHTQIPSHKRSYCMPGYMHAVYHNNRESGTGREERVVSLSPMPSRSEQNPQTSINLDCWPWHKLFACTHYAPRFVVKRRPIVYPSFHQFPRGKVISTLYAYTRVQTRPRIYIRMVQTRRRREYANIHKLTYANSHRKKSRTQSLRAEYSRVESFIGARNDKYMDRRLCRRQRPSGYCM